MFLLAKKNRIIAREKKKIEDFLNKYLDYVEYIIMTEYLGDRSESFGWPPLTVQHTPDEPMEYNDILEKQFKGNIHFFYAFICILEDKLDALKNNKT